VSPFICLIEKEIQRFMTVWVQTIIGPVVTAVLYQLIFGYQFASLSSGVAGVSYATFLIPGLVMMQILLNSFGNGSSSLIQSKYAGNIIFILMAPISPFQIYSAYLVSSIIRGVFVGLVTILGIGWFGVCMPQVWWAVIYFLIFGAAVTAGLGIIAGILCDKFDQLAGFQSFVMVPLIYLAGIFFSTNHLDGVWRYVAQLDPFLYIIDGFRYGFIAHTDYNVVTGAIFVAVFAVSINSIGYILIKKGVRIKH
jgi:ABC-2 type transport system permease protein